MIQLNDNDIIWLKEVWHQMVNTHKKPVYRLLRANTREITGAAYNPRKIHHCIAFNDGVLITALGVKIIDPESFIFSIMEKIIVHVRQELNDDADKTEFQLHDVANEIGEDYLDTKLAFYLLGDLGSFANTMSSNNTNDTIGYEKFDITSDYAFDCYDSYTSIDALLDDKKQKCFGGHDDNPPGNVDIFKELVNKGEYVDSSRIEEIGEIIQPDFDFKKLITLCNELNSCYASDCRYSVLMLVRAIIDHVPPIFSENSFDAVANHYSSEGNTRNFKKSMQQLNNSMKPIANTYLHSRIRKKESTITDNQIDFRSDLDVLLAEIIRIHK